VSDDLTIMPGETVAVKMVPVPDAWFDEHFDGDRETAFAALFGPSTPFHCRQCGAHFGTMYHCRDSQDTALVHPAGFAEPGPAAAEFRARGRTLCDCGPLDRFEAARCARFPVEVPSAPAPPARLRRRLRWPR
jgi:hypothetical protein